MADIYVEYLVRRKTTPAVTTKKILLAAGGIWALFLAFLYGPLLGGLALFAFLAGIALAVVAWRLIQAQQVEYEYTLTNGEIDVDKIIARRSRKRIYTFHCRDVEQLAPYGGEKIPGKVISACTFPGDQGVWRCTVKGRGPGAVLLFNPNDPLLDAMKRFLPGQVARDAARAREQQP